MDKTIIIDQFKHLFLLQLKTFILSTLSNNLFEYCKNFLLWFNYQPFSNYSQDRLISFYQFVKFCLCFRWLSLTNLVTRFNLFQYSTYLLIYSTNAALQTPLLIKVTFISCKWINAPWGWKYLMFCWYLLLLFIYQSSIFSNQTQKNFILSAN